VRPAARRRASGFFAFADVPAGTYTLRVTTLGFNTHEVTGIELLAGDSGTVRTIHLELAAVTEVVSVSADVALTPLTSGEKPSGRSSSASVPDRFDRLGRIRRSPEGPSPLPATASGTN
jgi:hypothetical protein